MPERNRKWKREDRCMYITDRKFFLKFRKIEFVKHSAIFIAIILLCCAVFSPIVMNGAVVPGDSEAKIMPLDVCNAATSVYAGSAEMPVVMMDGYYIIEPVFAGYLSREHSLHLFLSFDVSLDEPPRYNV